jgi:DUF971 family protein
MSHEGIKLVSAEEAARSSKWERPLSRDAVDPAKVRVDKTGGTGVEVDWKDGHRSAWTFAWLRAACPCAGCIEEREQAGRSPGEVKPEPRAALPLYKDPPRPREVQPVGHYAVKFVWNDGHETGIYSWDYLRRVCTCADCKKARGDFR